MSLYLPCGYSLRLGSFLFSSVQSLSYVWLSATPLTAARQASLSITNSWRLLKLMSIKSWRPSNHLLLCRRLLLLLSVFANIRVISNESVLHIRWPKYLRLFLVLKIKGSKTQSFLQYEKAKKLCVLLPLILWEYFNNILFQKIWLWPSIFVYCISQVSFTETSSSFLSHVSNYS